MSFQLLLAYACWSLCASVNRQNSTLKHYWVTSNHLRREESEECVVISDWGWILLASSPSVLYIPEKWSWLCDPSVRSDSFKFPLRVEENGHLPPTTSDDPSPVIPVRPRELFPTSSTYADRLSEAGRTSFDILGGKGKWSAGESIFYDKSKIDDWERRYRGDSLHCWTPLQAIATRAVRSPLTGLMEGLEHQTAWFRRVGIAAIDIL